jgi:hypothetical protein
MSDLSSRLYDMGHVMVSSMTFPTNCRMLSVAGWWSHYSAAVARLIILSSCSSFPLFSSYTIKDLY